MAQKCKHQNPYLTPNLKTPHTNQKDNSYTYYGDDLYVQADAPGPALAPLNFYANAATGHHMTTASAAGNAWAAANGFSLVAVQGYVFLTAAAAGPGAQPLEMWFSAARGDHFLVGTAQNRANAQGAGYTLLYNDSCTFGAPRPKRSPQTRTLNSQP